MTGVSAISMPSPTPVVTGLPLTRIAHELDCGYGPTTSTRKTTTWAAGIDQDSCHMAGAGITDSTPVVGSV